MRGERGGYRVGGLAAIRGGALFSPARPCWWCVPTCQLFDLLAFRLVGKLASWRGAGGAGGVIAECSDCIVLSVRVGGFSWFTPG